MPGDSTARKAEFPNSQIVRADETWSKSLVSPAIFREFLVSIYKWVDDGPDFLKRDFIFDVRLFPFFLQKPPQSNVQQLRNDIVVVLNELKMINSLHMLVL